MRLPLLCLLALFAPASLYAQGLTVPQGEARFNIVQANDGKTVGSTDCSVAATAGGYEISSRGELKMDKFSYSFSSTGRLDPQLNIVRDELSGTVNGAQVTFTMASDSTGRQFLVNILAKGQTTQNNFDRHQHTVLLPDLDSAAYVAMTHFALVRPATAWVVIPKENGLLVPATYNQQSDAHGTFHGQPITVHHSSVIVSGQNAISIEIYYTDDGAVLEADLPEQNFYVIRDGFKLQSRPQYVPPRNSAAPPQQQTAPQQPGYPPYEQPPQQQPPQYEMPQGSPAPQIQPQ